jgi:hypothetical protein
VRCALGVLWPERSADPTLGIHGLERGNSGYRLGVAPALPLPRGQVSRAIVGALRHAPGTALPPTPGADTVIEPLADDDLQLALYVIYELAYRGFEGVDERWEWDPDLLALRLGLERIFEDGLRRECPVPESVDARAQLLGLASSGGGSSLSGYMAEEGTLAQFRELAVHRSAYQLKEADPHTWVIPRLGGRAKAAAVRIQTDEYGGGRPEAMHSELFARTMTSVGLDPAYGRYLNLIPGVTLATVNLISMLGLHRRLRGALVGHLALFEMTSVGPMSRYGRCVERLGLGRDANRFYDVHVVADAHHQVIALDEMVGALLEGEPDLGADVVAGARWLGLLESRFTAHVLRSWSQGCTSLLDSPCRAGSALDKADQRQRTALDPLIQNRLRPGAARAVADVELLRRSRSGVAVPCGVPWW